MFDVRYQLLYATAGTVAAGADISVLYVAVFKTPLYDEIRGADNFRDYVDYMQKASAQFVAREDQSVLVTRLAVAGRELYCIHEYF